MGYPSGNGSNTRKYKHLLDKNKSPYDNYIKIQTAIMSGKNKQLGDIAWIGDQKPFQQIDPELMPFIKVHFPTAHFIHLIRHPAPVIQSSSVFKGGSLWKGMTKGEILDRWTMHEEWVQLEKEKKEVPILDIKYEDMIKNTEPTMQAIFKFLKVPYDDVLLKAGKQMTNSELKWHPGLNYSNKALAIMTRYGYKPRSFWLEKKWIVNSINKLKKF